MKTHKIDAPNGAIAVHGSTGAGPAIMLIHGNSTAVAGILAPNRRPIGQAVRLVAVDLPGHGGSDNAKDPSFYNLGGQGQAVQAAVVQLGLSDAVLVGWSLGGHVALEIAPDLPKARGFMIFGTPPFGFPPAMSEAFSAEPGDTHRLHGLDRPRLGGCLCRVVFSSGVLGHSAVFSGGRDTDGRESTLGRWSKYRARRIL